MADGDGLFLLVMPNGSKYWRLKYFVSSKEKLLALGVYPEVTLADARDRRAQARKMLAAGNDPGGAKKQAKQLATAKAANTFDAVAREWYDHRKHEWSPKTAGMVLDRLERHILPRLGQRPIAELNAPEVLAVLRVVEGSGALEMTQRVKHICGMIFMYAIATGRAERNPVSDLRGALKTPVTNHRAYLRESELPAYLKKLKAYVGTPLTKLALQFLLLTFVRTTELRAAQWEEIHWKKAEWRIPAERMKARREHVVPLSGAAVALFERMKAHRRDDCGTTVGGPGSQRGGSRLRHPRRLGHPARGGPAHLAAGVAVTVAAAPRDPAGLDGARVGGSGLGHPVALAAHHAAGLASVWADQPGGQLSARRRPGLALLPAFGPPARTSGRGPGRALPRPQGPGTLLARWAEGDKAPGLMLSARAPAASEAGW
jgi:integrase